MGLGGWRGVICQALVGEDVRGRGRYPERGNSLSSCCPLVTVLLRGGTDWVFYF